MSSRKRVMDGVRGWECLLKSFRELGGSATHEMNDLQSIVRLQRYFGPAGPCGDLPIELHGDAIPLQPEVLDELRKRNPIGALFRFAVYNDGHISSVADGRRDRVASGCGDD